MGSREEDMEAENKSGSGTTPIVLRRHFPHLGPYVAPRTVTERKLAEMWCDGLGMDQVSVDDIYENLGGDSLLAARLFAEIEKVFGVTVPWRSFAEAPTVELLARRIDTLAARYTK
jgi:acyl carrier protein